MRITDVKTVLLTASSGDDPFLRNVRKVRSAAFIEIRTDGDLVGIGETGVGYHMPEIVPEIVEFFRPILVGLSDDQINPRLLWRRMIQCGGFWTRVGIGTSIVAGLEGGLWDLRGKMDGVPVHRLLGDCLHERLLCYATGCESPFPWSELARKVDMYRQAGYVAAKFGAGWYNHASGEAFSSDSTQAWVDMEAGKLEQLRDHVGKDFRICLDGHMGNVDEHKRAWDAGVASSVLKALEPFDVFFFEEPLDYRDMAGYAEVCRATSIPIAGGEVLTSREEFGVFAQAGGFDMAQPDASVVGIGPMLEIASMFAAQHKHIAPHNWMAGPATMQNIHLAFATPNVAIVETAALPGGLHTDVYGDGYRFEDGYLLPPEVPGLGVRLDDRIKNKHKFVHGSGEWNMVPGKQPYM